jgi:minor extracellular serine protease Vpr
MNSRHGNIITTVLVVKQRLSTRTISTCYSVLRSAFLALPLLLSTLAAITMPVALWGQAQTSTRFQTVQGGGHWSKTTFVPRALQRERVKVFLSMSAPSVAEARASSISKTITGEREAAVVAQAHAQHVAAEPYVVAMGGTVLSHLHHAINGIKVEVDKADVDKLAGIPGVVKVLRVPVHQLNNATTVPFIGAPQVWSQTPGFRGERVKIAIIDTGIDYTHANFGGPGTVAAWNAAFAASTQPADPSLFGCTTCKVKGGTDLVGDNYNANFSDPAHAPLGLMVVVPDNHAGPKQGQIIHAD